MAPETSIVIRTFNEEKRLPALFEALARQRYRLFETIVVDSGSVDRTVDIAERSATSLLRIPRRDFTFGHSLNRGISAASGACVVIVSAHTIPVNDLWLESLIHPLADGRTGMVFGRQVGPPGSKFGEIQDLRRTFGGIRQLMNAANLFGNNANSAIRRDLWIQRPFDESLPGLEDIEWAKYWLERGHPVVYEPGAAIYHFHEETWPQIRRRYYREALAAKRIGVKSPVDALSEIVRESAYLVDDLIQSPSAGDAAWRSTGPGRISEIVRFRANKVIGTVAGLLDGSAMQNPETKDKIYFDRSFKAVVISAPGRAAIQEIQVPAVNPGDVLIRVACVGVCATDLEILDGSLGYYKTGMARYPIVPGHEVSGRAVRVGPNVRHIQEGDAVVVECIQSCGECGECRRDNPIGCPDRAELGVIRRNGGYAEYVVVPGRFVHRLPPDLDFRRAALAEPLAVVMKGLRRVSRAWPVEPETKTCAVLGAGPIGHLCAQVLADRGHQVTVFDRDEGRRRLFDGSAIRTSGDIHDLKGFDVLIEATGDPNVLQTVLTGSAAGSTLLLLGLPYGEQPFTFERIVAFDKTVVGSVGSGAEDFRDAILFLQRLNARPFLECVMPFEKFSAGWDMARQKRSLKVILEMAR